jgi:rsbT co-antagonist protein RsbR
VEQLQASLSEDERAGLRDVIQISRDNQAVMLQHRREVLKRHAPMLTPPDEQLEAEAEEGLRALERMTESGDLGAYLTNMRESFAPVASSGLAFSTVSRAVVELIGPANEMLEQTYASDPKRAMRAIRALHRLETEALIVAGEAYATAREDKVESEYADTVRRLSTPVIQVWDDVLVMPLVGVLDSTRAQQMMEQLLERVVALQARLVIVDITGVPTVDTAVAQHLIRTTKASRLVGATTILVGISPQVAQTLVRLGVVLDNVDTFIDLRSGLEYALASLGFAVQRSTVAAAPGM